MANLAKFSEHGLNKMYRRVDIDALSDRAKYRYNPVPVRIATASGAAATAYFVQNTSTDHPIGCLGVAGTLVSAVASSSRVPAGGALTWQIVAIEGTKTVLTDTANPESVSANVGQELTAATTNVALAATEMLYLRCTADNSAVGTDARDVFVTLVWVPTEETTLTE
jgi:hypothetical protein